ncbi:hypothetical protein ONZ45_g4869 [Pleurotus djamor]|nr:hypothetical protein ONZ45_g4869 [Pleurotus djamor]
MSLVNWFYHDGTSLVRLGHKVFEGVGTARELIQGAKAALVLKGDVNDDDELELWRCQPPLYMDRAYGMLQKPPFYTKFSESRSEGVCVFNSLRLERVRVDDESTLPQLQESSQPLTGLGFLPIHFLIFKATKDSQINWVFQHYKDQHIGNDSTQIVHTVPALIKSIKEALLYSRCVTADDELELWRCQPPLTSLAMLSNPKFTAKLSRARSDTIRVFEFQSVWLERVRPDSSEIVASANRAFGFDFLVFKDYSHGPIPNLIERYSDLLIKVRRWGPLSITDLERNGVIEVFSQDSGLPQFVLEFDRKLSQLTTLPKNSADALVGLSNPKLLSNYCSPVPAADTTSTASSREASRTEIAQLVGLSLPWNDVWSQSNCTSLFMSIMTGPLLFAVAEDPSRCIRSISASRWPFPIVAKGPLDSSSEFPTKFHSLRTLHLRPSFSILQGELPRCLVHFSTSIPPEEGDMFPDDLLRLILSASSVVRFANAHLQPFNVDKDFTLLAFYVRPSGDADRMIFFQQPNGSSVHYISSSVNLFFDTGRIRMALWFNNLVHILSPSSSSVLGITNSLRVETFNASVQQYCNIHPMKSFDGGQQKEDTDNSHSTSENDARSHTMDELNVHGYKVQPDVWEIEGGGGEMRRFDTLPPGLCFVRRDSNSPELVAKKTNGTEVDILEFIKTLSPPSDHIIPLLDSVRGRSSHFVIFPYIHSSLARLIYLFPQRLFHYASSFCVQLVTAAAYLHRHGIAHRDIKPSNCLIDDNGCLKLADFDIARRVRDEDEEVTDYCGTVGWTAPEVEQKPRKYSPIKADRWSCGRVIFRILSYVTTDYPNQVFTPIANRLTTTDPKQRLSLDEAMDKLSAQGITCSI